MLKISTAGLAQMRAHCERSYPEEACGVLIGTSESGVRRVHQVTECGNDRTDAPHNRYRIAPAELIATQKQARNAGEEIVGFYHSHPNFPARWSATDLAEAHWLHCSYVIVSVDSGRAGDTASFVLEGSSEEDKHFTDEAIEAY